MTIPAATNRAHLEQRDRRCDTLTVLNMAAGRRPGRRYADMNTCPGKDTDWNLHWPDGPGKNHFDHIIDKHTGKRRLMTHAEYHLPVVHWAKADVLRWRKKVGRHWVRPYSVIERQRQARLRRVVICWEVKSPISAIPAYAARLVNAVEASGWAGYFMTLVTMRSWGLKLSAIHKAGGQTALMTHGARRPADFAHFDPYVDRLWPNHWGHASSRLGAS